MTDVEKFQKEIAWLRHMLDACIAANTELKEKHKQEIDKCLDALQKGIEERNRKKKPVISKSQAQRLTRQGPKPGEICRHWKGGLYTVMARAIKEDALEPLVIYQSNKYGYMWARTVENFTEEVEPGVTRFRREED